MKYVKNSGIKRKWLDKKMDLNRKSNGFDVEYSLCGQSIQIALALVWPKDDTIVCQEVAAQPPFARRWNDATQHCKIACIINLPILRANDQNRSLILCAAIQADCVQTTDLLRFILIDWIGIFVLISQQCPDFHCASCRDGKDDIILALRRP